MKIESFRARLTAVTKEKYENEEKVIRLSEEIEKKVKLFLNMYRIFLLTRRIGWNTIRTRIIEIIMILVTGKKFLFQSKQANELQKKNGQLQKTVAELDQVAQEQLHALADQSQTAISATQTKLLQVNNQVQQLTQFVKVRYLSTQK